MKPSRSRVRLGLTLSLILLCLGTIARADPERRVDAHFLFDGVVGLGTPIADAVHRDSFYPSPKIGLALGAEIWLTGHIGLAPELTLDGEPFLPKRSSAVTTGRVRALPGLRLLFRFAHGHAFFVRYLAGLDLLVFGPGGTLGAGKVSAGFGTEPALGMQFKVARRAVGGFTTGFPIGLHDLEGVRAVNVDFDASFFVGYRR
jgi:hypothetical protein